MSGAVCVLGSFMTDLIVNAPRRPLPGETLVGTDFGIYLGGKGFNQVVAAARSGADTAMIGRLGDDDFGDAFRDALDEEGIDRTHVALDLDHGTGVGVPVVEPDGQNSIIIVPRANAAVAVTDVALAVDAIRSADVLLLQLELPVETALEAARIAAEAGTTVVLNPAPWTPVPDELLARTDVLVPNEPEAAQLLGLEVAQLDADDAVRRIVERYGVAGVIITLGERGAVIAADDLTTHIAPHELTAVDTVGAGDAYCGALAARLADGASLLDAARYANAAAAIAVTRVGGARSAPRRAEVEALLAPLADTAPA